MINNRKEKTVLTETRTDRNTFFTVQKYNCYKKMYLLSVLVCFQKVDSYVYNCGFVIVAENGQKSLTYRTLLNIIFLYITEMLQTCKQRKENITQGMKL